MRDGDLAGNRSLRPQNRDIVIAEVDGGFTVKQLQTTPNWPFCSMNNAYSPIFPNPDELTIFGVVTHWVHRARVISDVCTGWDKTAGGKREKVFALTLEISH